jgi:hypothetical protein
MTFIREFLKSDIIYMSPQGQNPLPPQAMNKFWARQCFQVMKHSLAHVVINTAACLYQTPRLQLVVSSDPMNNIKDTYSK